MQELSSSFLDIISIHALLAESDQLQGFLLAQGHNFYPRSPCGERLTNALTAFIAPHFYPRSPCGERPDDLGDRLGNYCISIHALLAESDSMRIDTVNSFGDFYPRSPCGERRYWPCVFVVGCADFYPRSPCGERHAADISTRRGASISIHALLAESDIGPLMFNVQPRNFYPRSPCGERQS